ncbi:MAG TPA: hypothetical protein PL009_07855 [Flavipsychrobacter sp.]|nr:hypothetical protein [Flavipsychrobacter sp.]
MKKSFVLLIFCVAIISLISFDAASPEPPPPPDGDMVESYEQDPPLATHFYVQKLSTPVSGGNMIMTIEYADGWEMPDSLEIHLNLSESVWFHDDGETPDSVEGDRRYSGYIDEDINAFLSQIESLQNAIVDSGHFLSFEGHVGEFVPSDQLILFDFEAFNDLQPVEVDPNFFKAFICQDVKKEYSLFITDINVVESGAYTYDFKNATGNLDGNWTFGKLMANAANGTVSNRAFLKSFVKQWIQTTPSTVNGQSVGSRTNGVITYLIRPWLKTAYNDPNKYVTDLNWESLWDDASSQTGITDLALVRSAPFKLTAIVNRIDLRGNSAYSSLLLKNSGETRFIFTLLAPYANSSFYNAWDMPRHTDQCSGRTNDPPKR